MVRLKSCDCDEYIEVPQFWCVDVVLIQDMLADDPMASNAEETVVITLGITFPLLKVLTDFMRLAEREGPLQHVQKPIKSSNMVELVGKVYANFVDFGGNLKMLFDVTKMANFMHATQLLELCVIKHATHLRTLDEDGVVAKYGGVRIPEERKYTDMRREGLIFARHDLQ